MRYLFYRYFWRYIDDSYERLRETLFDLSWKLGCDHNNEFLRSWSIRCLNNDSGDSGAWCKKRAGHWSKWHSTGNPFLKWRDAEWTEHYFDKRKRRGHMMYPEIYPEIEC